MRTFVVLLSVVTVFGFLRYSLAVQAENYVQDFYLQNSIDLSRGEVFPIARKLGALAKRSQLVCIYGYKGDIPFFEEKKSQCGKGLLQTEKLLQDSIQDIKIEFTVRMADEVILGLLIFVMIQVALLFLMLLGERRSVLEKMHGELATAAIARQIGHDIRSPLAVLKYSLRAKNELDPMQTSALARLQELSSHLLKKEENTLHLGEAHTILSEVIREKNLEYAEEVTFRFSEQNSRGIFLPGDAFFWRRIFSNLFNNSIEAKRSDRVSISISIKEESNFGVIEIVDDGKGFESEFLDSLQKKARISNVQSNQWREWTNFWERLFGAEVRPQDVKTIGKKFGTGLGLSSAKQYLQQFGGELRIQSSKGNGASIGIGFPLIRTIVLIDDDREFGEIWKLWAEKKKIPFLFFPWSKFHGGQKTQVEPTGQALSRLVDKIPKDSLVFVDKQMGAPEDYLKFAKELSKSGMRQLYLCTGESVDEEALPEGFLGAVKKEPPVVEFNR